MSLKKFSLWKKLKAVVRRKKAKPEVQVQDVQDVVSLPVHKPVVLESQLPQADGQFDSLLFKLPAELREIVYRHYFDYAMPDNCDYVLRQGSPVKVHIIRDSHNRFSHISCAGSNTHCTYRCYEYRDYRACCGNMLALSLTCRRAYNETIDLMYAQHTFVFESRKDIHDFLHRTSAHRLSSIHGIHLNWDIGHCDFGNCHCNFGQCPAHWKQVFDILATMPLTQFHARFIDTAPLRRQGTWESAICTQLGKLTVEDTKYQVNWMPRQRHVEEFGITIAEPLY